MSQKHIFIGLGGAGVNTVSQIKYKIYTHTPSTASKSSFEKMNETYRFLFFDTDQRDLDKYNRIYKDKFENGTVAFINPQTDLVSLSKGNPHSIYEAAKQNPESLINHRILEACSDELAAKIPDQPLKFGAGAFRMKSRISFARSMSEFQQKLQAHIEALNSVKNSGGEENTIFYWVVCSTNGGTGSGIINDVLYYVNMQHKRSIGDGDPHLVLTQYMPKYYIDKNSTEEKYSLNAFAVFSEIEASKAWSMDERRNKLFHRLAFVKDYNLIDEKTKYDPFYYLIPVDCQTDNGTNIGDGMYSNTAEMLYYIHDGEGGAALHSDVDNYMHDLYNQRPKGFLVPMGYIALRKPDEDFNNYMKMRLERDLLVYGLFNENCRKADNEEIEAFYNNIMKTDCVNALERYKNNIINKEFRLSDDADDDGFKLDEDKFNNARPTAILNSFLRCVDGDRENCDFAKAVSDTKKALWANVDKIVIGHGFEYAVDFVGRLNDFALKSIKELNTSRESGRPVIPNELRTLFDDASTVTVKERILDKSSQKEQVEKYISELKKYTDKLLQYEVDCKIFSILENFCNNDGNGEISRLKDHLEGMLNKVKEMATDASKQYRNLAISFQTRALDVTSVYLPNIAELTDGESWVKDNRFSRIYQRFIRNSNESIEGQENKPLRNGDYSVEKFISDKVYSNNKDSKFAKDILKTYSVDSKIRFFANENLESISAYTILEAFITYAKKYMDETLRTSKEVQDSWSDKGIAKFFEELSSDEKDKVRRSLSPSLFFNYQENKIAVDYREFLIFVAQTEDLARAMLGYQEGNPKHRFIQSGEANAAFVLKAKYGLSFSDYRMYDNLKALYDKAPFREKYHFHRYFSEYGEDLLPENLPVEMSPAHKVFARLMLLKMYERDFKDFFYVPEYLSMQEDFTNSILKENADGTFAVAKPQALSEKDGKICITVNDKGSKLFTEYVGDSFVKAFNDYERNFVRDSIAASYSEFISVIKNHKILVETDEVVEDGSHKRIQKSGKDIIIEHFDKNRKALLALYDKKIVESPTDAEKALYKTLFNVLMEDIDNTRKF